MRCEQKDCCSFAIAPWICKRCKRLEGRKDYFTNKYKEGIKLDTYEVEHTQDDGNKSTSTYLVYYNI